MMNPRDLRDLRVSGFVSVAALAFFVALTGWAMVLYPGGTFLDATTHGYDFWLNFWCDLLRDPALGGAPNDEGARFAALGMIALGVALVPFARLCTRLMRAPRGRRARFVRVASVFIAVAVASVALLPSDRFPRLHPPAVLLGGGLGCVGAVVCVLESARRFGARPVEAALGIVALVCAVIDMALYARNIYLHVPGTAALPIIQRLATLALVGWMAMTVVRAFKTTSAVRMGKPSGRPNRR